MFDLHQTMEGRRTDCLDNNKATVKAPKREVTLPTFEIQIPVRL